MENRSPLYIPGEAFNDCQSELMIYAFFSGVDAGEVGTMSIDQLLHALPHERVATFQIDDRFDYRSRRPRIQIKNWVLTQMQEPYLAIDKVTDYTGNSFLVMHGMEPDTGWHQVGQSVIEILKKAGVKKVYDLLGVASNVPHTRQSFINLVAPEGTYLPEQSHLPGNFMVNSSFGQYLQMFLEKVGIKSQGMLLAVPYYLADGQFPAGAVVMLEFLAKELGLDLPVGDLEAVSTRMHKDITKQIENSIEVQEMLAVLEKQYDESQLFPGGGPGKESPAAFMMPDGEKLAAKLEQFLQNIELSQVNNQEDAGAEQKAAQKSTEAGKTALIWEKVPGENNTLASSGDSGKTADDLAGASETGAERSALIDPSSSRRESRRSRVSKQSEATAQSRPGVPGSSIIGAASETEDTERSGRTSRRALDDGTTALTDGQTVFDGYDQLTEGYQHEMERRVPVSEVPAPNRYSSRSARHGGGRKAAHSFDKKPTKASKSADRKEKYDAGVSIVSGESAAPGGFAAQKGSVASGGVGRPSGRAVQGKSLRIEDKQTPGMHSMAPSSGRPSRLNRVHGYSQKPLGTTSQPSEPIESTESRRNGERYPNRIDSKEHASRRKGNRTSRLQQRQCGAMDPAGQTNAAMDPSGQTNVAHYANLPVKDPQAANKRLHDFLHKLGKAQESEAQNTYDAQKLEQAQNTTMNVALPPAPKAPQADSVPTQLRFPSRRNRGEQSGRFSSTNTDPVINLRAGEDLN